MDDEGNASNIKKRLVDRDSCYNPSRKITKDEYFHLWKRNIEFDNFTCEEIAQAMTDLAEGKYTFSSEEIKECCKSFGKKGDPLTSLSKEKLNYEISKIYILEKLFDTIINSDAERQQERKIINVLKKIIDLAIINSNCQPTSLDHRKKNQESDFYNNTISK